MNYKRFAMTLVAVIAASFILASPAQLAETKKEIPPPGTITFVGKNKVATANGTFKKWKITESTFDAAAPEKIRVTIVVDVASIDTKIKKRDDHLRNADFFDVEKYPTATLTVHSVEAGQGENSFIGKLDFEMHGVKKTYPTFAFRTTGDDPVKVDGTFTINRMDFKIGEPKTVTPMSIVEEIPITFTATLPE